MPISPMFRDYRESEKKKNAFAGNTRSLIFNLFTCRNC